MNLVLFEPDEIGRKLPSGDARVTHLVRVLKRRVGETFDAGILNGPVGKGRITAIGAEGLSWQFAAVDGRAGPEGAAGTEVAPAEIDLIVGLPRPQTARKILQEGTALGLRSMRFVRTEKGDAGYAGSTLWSSGEWRRHVRAGLEQAFATREPLVTHGTALEEAWRASPHAAAVVLDNYEAGASLGSLALRGPALIAIGGERGWSGSERDFFRSEGATLAHLGPRVLRTETACVAAIAIVRSKLDP